MFNKKISGHNKIWGDTAPERPPWLQTCVEQLFVCSRLVALLFHKKNDKRSERCFGKRLTGKQVNTQQYGSRLIIHRKNVVVNKASTVKAS